MDNFAIYPFPFGFLQIGYENDKVIFLKKLDTTDSYGIKNKLTDIAYKEITEYLEGNRKDFSFPYHLKGTDFQKKVWNELCRIPYGETRSYKDIAIAIGNPKAVRAVGMANNRNPMMIVVPCHRVVGSDGKMVGYAGGISVKETLLELEGRNSR